MDSSDLKLVTVPAETLRMACREIPDVPRGIILGTAMLRFMEQNHGVGLAAPQIGWQGRLFVASETGTPNGIIFINPKIIAASVEMELAVEGCLSIPGVRLPISRHKSVTVEYDTLLGRETLIATGLLARIIQHEYDHLEGVLISDRFESQNNEPCMKNHLD